MSSVNSVQRSENTFFYDSTRQGGISAEALSPDWHCKGDQANISETAKELAQNIATMRTAVAEQLSAADRYAAAQAFAGDIINELTYGSAASKSYNEQSSMFLDRGYGAFTTTSKQGTVIGVSTINSFSSESAVDKSLMTVQITRKDGFQLNLPLNENLRVNDLEGGGLSVYFADSGMRKIYDAAGNETIIEGETDENNLGTAGDDIIINLHSSRVDGGDGDDTIINLARNATITGGAGNDTIIVPVKSSGLTIDGGEGDDRIAAESLWNSRVFIKEGADELKVGSMFQSKIESDGESRVEMERMTSSTLTATGQSLTADINVIDASTIDMNTQSNNLTGLVFGGARVSAGNGNTSISGDTAFSTQFVTGNGNNNIEFYAISGTSLISGSGNDEVRIMNNMRNSDVDTGDGDDYIYTGGMDNSKLNGGAGDDIIAVRRANGSQINGGDGDDVIVAYGLGNTSVNGGDGKNTIISPSLSDATENDTLYRWSWGTKWVDEFFKTAEQGSSSYESQQANLNQAFARADEIAKESEEIASTTAKQMTNYLRTRAMAAYNTAMPQSFK